MEEKNLRLSNDVARLIAGIILALCFVFYAASDFVFIGESGDGILTTYYVINGILMLGLAALVFFAVVFRFNNLDRIVIQSLFVYLLISTIFNGFYFGEALASFSSGQTFHGLYYISFGIFSLILLTVPAILYIGQVKGKDLIAVASILFGVAALFGIIEHACYVAALVTESNFSEVYIAGAALEKAADVSLLVGLIFGLRYVLLDIKAHPVQRVVRPRESGRQALSTKAARIACGICMTLYFASSAIAKAISLITEVTTEGGYVNDSLSILVLTACAIAMIVIVVFKHRDLDLAIVPLFIIACILDIVITYPEYNAMALIAYSEGDVAQIIGGALSIAIATLIIAFGLLVFIGSALKKNVRTLTIIIVHVACFLLLVVDGAAIAGALTAEGSSMSEIANEVATYVSTFCGSAGIAFGYYYLTGKDEKTGQAKQLEQSAANAIA